MSIKRVETAMQIKFENTNEPSEDGDMRLILLQIKQELEEEDNVKMSLPSHRYYQPPNLGGVKYRAEGRFGNTMNIQSFVF